MNRLAPFVALGCLLAGASPALAADSEAAAETEYSYALWTGLMSPYCPGRVLIDCPSPQADELRNWIQDQEAAGRSRAEVEGDLYARFGDIILQAPRVSGFGLAAYVIPLLAAIAGVAVVVIFLRRQARGGPRTPAPSVSPPSRVALDPDLERRIDEELEAIR